MTRGSHQGTREEERDVEVVNMVLPHFYWKFLRVLQELSRAWRSLLLQWLRGVWT